MLNIADTVTALQTKQLIACRSDACSKGETFTETYRLSMATVAWGEESMRMCGKTGRTADRNTATNCNMTDVGECCVFRIPIVSYAPQPFFPNTVTLYSAASVTDQVSHP